MGEMSHDLMGNVPINDLNEWDLHKLGWFKSKKTRNHISPQSQVKRAFAANVKNCKENSYTSEVFNVNKFQ